MRRLTTSFPGNGFCRVQCDAGAAGFGGALTSDMSIFTGDSRPPQISIDVAFVAFVRFQFLDVFLAVVADRERRANFHRALSGCGFCIACRLFGKINGRFVFVHFEKIWRFFETGATQGAGSIDVPRSGNIQRLPTVFVRHDSRCTK